MSSSCYRNTAAEIAAAAVYELFPDVELYGGGETSTGFVYELLFPHPIHDETLPLIEQQMRQIARERREVRLMEMVPFSAKELLRAKGHAARAEQVRSSGLVHIIEIGSFYDLSPQDVLKNSHQLCAFKLDPIEQLGSGRIRLSGYVSASKGELRDFLKRVKEYDRHRHEAVGEMQGLWKGGVWLEKGLKAREKLIQLFEKNFEGPLEQISAPRGIDRIELVKELGRAGVWEVHTPSGPCWDAETGLLQTPGLQMEIFCIDPIFCLRSAEKSLNILGLKYNEEFFVVDTLDRKWSVVEKRRVPGGMAIAVSIDRILALLLESGGYPTDND